MAIPSRQSMEFLKLRNTNKQMETETANACQKYFSFEQSSIQLGKHKEISDTKFMTNRIVWCC